MPDEQKTQLRLEIAHVLFMDIVGYSKLLIDEQSEALQELNEIVRKTDAVRAAEAAGQLIFLPTGDGMALVFTGSVEEPVECALHLLSKRVADDLVQFRRWQPYLHELGDFEVKHGVIVSVVNLYADIVGNPKPPERLKGSKRIGQRAASTVRPKRSPVLISAIVVGLMLFTLAALAI